MTTKKAKTKRSSKKPNPLYTVDEKTNVVEEAKNLIDFILKKLNLEATLATLMQLFQMLIESIQSYPMFQAVMQFIDGLMEQVEQWIGGFEAKPASETSTVSDV